MEHGNAKKIFSDFLEFFPFEINFFYDRSALDFDSNFGISYDKLAVF